MLNCTSGHRIHETAKTFNKSASKISRRTNRFKQVRREKIKDIVSNNKSSKLSLIYKSFVATPRTTFLTGFFEKQYIPYRKSITFAEKT